MGLTKSQVETLNHYFTIRGIRPRCPFCSHEELSAEELVATPVIQGGKALIPGPTVNTLLLVCKRCAYVLHFSATLMGLDKNP